MVAQCYPLHPASMAGADEHRRAHPGHGPMRQRLRLSRSRSMARRRVQDRRLDLSPRARRIGGWLAAIVIVLVIAGAVRIFGGNADGDAVLATPSPAPSTAVYTITFGTELGDDRVVPASAETNRFVADDLFAYSVAEAPPAASCLRRGTSHWRGDRRGRPAGNRGSGHSRRTRHHRLSSTGREPLRGIRRGDLRDDDLAGSGGGPDRCRNLRAHRRTGAERVCRRLSNEKGPKPCPSFGP